MSVPKSWRTLEIMQQCRFGFTEEYVSEICKNWSVIKDYAYIKHDCDMNEDGTSVENHIHLMLRFNCAVPTSAILKKLDGVCEVQHLQHKKGPWGTTEVDGRIAPHQDQLAQHDRRE